jgi:hypothetical protein
MNGRVVSLPGAVLSEPLCRELAKGYLVSVLNGGHRMRYTSRLEHRVSGVRDMVLQLPCPSCNRNTSHAALATSGPADVPSTEAEAVSVRMRVGVAAWMLCLLFW